MRQTALILLAIVLVAAIVCAVLVSTLPRARVTIRAIGPTGKFWTVTHNEVEKSQGPMWQFAITNEGNATAVWQTYLFHREVEGVGNATIGLDGQSFQGVLLPGQGVMTNMAVGVGGIEKWRGCVTWVSQPSRLESKLIFLGDYVPRLRGLFPSKVYGSYLDVWHTNINVAPISALPQNGTNP